MKITNKMNLPQSFVEMATRDYTYEPNEYRVTSLLKGIRETILERRHRDEMEQDVSDMIWLLFGTACHNILEHQKEADNELKEERIKVKVGDYLLSGQFDLYNADKKMITDYKTASVWKIIYGSFDDWRRQLLIYAWMLRSIGFEVDKAQVVAILKDHGKRDAKFKADYPKLPVHTVAFKFTEKDFAEIEVWLKEKFEQISWAEKLDDNELPLCTQDERFNSGDKFAVMKKGAKKALRVFDSQEEAEKWMADKDGDFIEVRPGEDKKCADYCSVNKFCSYWQERSKANEHTQETNGCPKSA